MCAPSPDTCQSDSDCAVDQRCDLDQQRCVVLPRPADAGAGDRATGDAAGEDAASPYRANAGPDQQVALNATARLSSGASVLPPGASEVVYQWALVQRPAGSTATLEHGDTPSATLRAIDPHARYSVELTISADGVELPTDEVAVSVLNTLPRASAGDDLVISIGSSTPLDGSGSVDDDGDALAFSWTILPPDNGATLTGAHTAHPTFLAATGFSGLTTVQLTVTDPESASATDAVAVTTDNLPPQIALAPEISVPHQYLGAPQNQASATAQLDATVADPEGEGLTVVWSLLTCPDGAAAGGVCPSGLVPAFSAPASASTGVTFRRDPLLGPIAGSYTVEIVATDAGSRTARAQATVTVENRPPAGTASAVSLAHTFGSGEYRCEVPFAPVVEDADGDPLAISFAVEPSATVLHSGGGGLLQATSAELSAALLGPYVVTAAVSDRQGAAVDVTVTIGCTNAAPTAAVSGATSVAHRYQDPLYVGDISLLVDASDADGDPLTCLWSASEPVDGVDYTALPREGIAFEGPIRSVAGQVVADHGFRVTCGDGLADAIVDRSVTVTNSPPLVEAGSSITTDGHTYLSASGQYQSINDLAARPTPASVSDPNGDPFTAIWELAGVPPNVYVYLDQDAANPTVTVLGDANAIASYQLGLTAVDSLSASASDTMILTVTNRPPVLSTGNPYLTTNQVSDATPCGYKGSTAISASQCQIMADDKSGGERFSYSTALRLRVTDEDGDPITAVVTLSGSSNVVTLDGLPSPVTFSGTGTVSALDVPIAVSSRMDMIDCDPDRMYKYERFDLEFWSHVNVFEDITTVATSVVDSLGAAPATAPPSRNFVVHSTSQHQECP